MNFASDEPAAVVQTLCYLFLFKVIRLNFFPKLFYIMNKVFDSVIALFLLNLVSSKYD